MYTREPKKEHERRNRKGVSATGPEIVCDEAKGRDGEQKSQADGMNQYYDQGPPAQGNL